MAKSPKPKAEQSLVFRGRESLSPYPQSRLAPAFSTSDVQAQVAKAEHFLDTIARAKLELIAEQMRTLQAQAQRIVEEAQRDLDLHHVECRFIREPGGVYHLYEKDNGQQYFSILSPEDWGELRPHRFVESYRLRPDMQYEPVIDSEAE